MADTLIKQNHKGYKYTAFTEPDELTQKDIGKSVIISGHDGKVFVLYKIHPEGSPGFKDGGVECIITNKGVGKHYFLLDQVKFYDEKIIIKKKGKYKK